jgi:hypothetical protein
VTAEAITAAAREAVAREEDGGERPEALSPTENHRHVIQAVAAGSETTEAQEDAAAGRTMGRDPAAAATWEGGL